MSSGFSFASRYNRSTGLDLSKTNAEGIGRNGSLRHCLQITLKSNSPKQWRQRPFGSVGAHNSQQPEQKSPDETGSLQASHKGGKIQSIQAAMIFFTKDAILNLPGLKTHRSFCIKEGLQGVVHNPKKRRFFCKLY